MAQKYYQEVVIIEVTVEKPVGTTYSDREVTNLLKVTSTDRAQVKVKCFGPQTPDE